MNPPAKPPRHPFLGAHVSPLDALAARAALFGAPHGTPYPGIDNRVHAGAAEAIRAAIKEDGEWANHWDFDIGGSVLGEGEFPLADLGDLKTTAKDGAKNRALIEAATRAILARGAVPLMIGGDDSVPIPFLAGFADHGPITILQIDAHIDWRDERYGETLGFSSTMRRASEMAHVERIVQAGARGLGSAREGEVMTAANWGAKIIPAAEIHRHGPAAALAEIPAGARVVIALDLDSLDGATMPAVAHPSPGGLSYDQVTGLIAGVAAKAKIAGFDMVEFVPAKDTNGYSAYVAGRILWNVAGRIVQG